MDRREYVIFEHVQRKMILEEVTFVCKQSQLNQC